MIKLKLGRVISDNTKPLTALSLLSGPDQQVAQAIDHTLLAPDATPDQIEAVCDEALKHGFKAVCVHGWHIPRVAKRLKGSKTVPCAVIGFPQGAGKSSAKAFEAAEAVRDGAAEVDMVINLGALKAGDFATVYNDIAAVVKAAAPADVKVILETVFLSDAQKVAGAYIAAEAGAAWVKTCTGFAGGGASAADVRLMWKTVRDRGVQVKASAGIRTFEKCKEMFDAGAGRIGT
uniref:deoxyribose-phosphate aldolase n=2 Tax=Schizophyllum commune (strain H4-8 / FGSC 9210) TaxID=578458 RepID=D8PTY1_SCHCM